MFTHASKKFLHNFANKVSKSTAPGIKFSQNLVVRKTTTATFTSAETKVVKGQKVVGYWLAGCASLTVGAVVLGGVTRLTESGLSMVDWHLIKGMKPPTTEEEWMNEFKKYQEFPEFKIMNHSMTLNEFKFIWHMEWGHRMWGRFIGLAYFLPFSYFLSKGYLNKALKMRCGMLGALLCFQGGLGWFMVKSGLDEKIIENNAVPRVSQYRLAAHLGSAFLFYSGLFWTTLGQLLPKLEVPNTKEVTKLRRFAMGTKGLVFLTAVSGAFVAGLDAGLTYNTYPKMADKWVPDDLVSDYIEPKYKNIFENPTTVQFDHRLLGHSTLAAVMYVCYKAHKTAGLPARTLLASRFMAGMAVLQVALGVTTLLTYVPTPTAAMHQSGSLALLSFALWFSHELRRFPK